jgi:hypothetical protein
MAFDTSTRNRLAKFVGEARRVLADEFIEQLQSLYGISATGEVTPIERLGHLDAEGRELANTIRQRIAYLVSSSDDALDATEAAVARLTREQAFTIVNRLAAIRMAETRGLIVESVGKQYQSKGFKVFESVAGSAIGETFDRYRCYLFCLFDELAIDLGVLFDRRSPQAMLFPREPALLALLDLLDAPDLQPLWAEDETIGWIYQYYNDEAERKKMREESAAPRNSRELAVRNQFFTPRYVVEFLTDNTLGRIWYEMTQGQTSLKDSCRYLVRRPNEIFLKAGKSAPENAAGIKAKPGDSLSQAELLEQAIHIQPRPLKDPREMRLLDPACGSMHFGLYAFDLFTVIYDEAWEMAHSTDVAAKSADTFHPFIAFAANFANKAAFLRDVPRLIIEHNLHGIDIDPRAAQIAGLSLWLRAQRAWHQANVKPTDRPRITRSNLVCAEPMPGDKELLREFVEQQFPVGEQAAFRLLLEKIFDRMTLAGEAGSLLRIEEEIRATIAEAKKIWEQEPHHEQKTLFAELASKQNGGQKRLDLSGITTDEFWERAEERIYDALAAYAEQAEESGGLKRRLFADDAAQGFAFIDLFRKQYDAVVMNPPFGEAAVEAKDYVFGQWAISKYDLAAAFAHRAGTVLAVQGLVGSLTNRSIFYGQMLEDWRRFQFVAHGALLTFGDLGIGVLDAAMVEAVAYTFSSTQGNDPAIFFKAICGERDIAECIVPLAQAQLPAEVYLISVSSFDAIPAFPFAYWTPADWLASYSRFESLEAHGFVVRQGMESSDNFRFVRLWWETPAKAGKWYPYSKGGWFGPYWRDMDVVVNWGANGEEVKEFSASIYGTWTKQITNSDLYGVAALCYPASRVEFSPRVLPPGCIVGCKGPVVALKETEKASPTIYLSLLAVMASSAFRALVNLTTTSGDTMRKSYREKAVAAVPIPPVEKISAEVVELTLSIVNRIRELESSFETCRSFIEPRPKDWKTGLAREIRKSRERTDVLICDLYGFRGPGYVAFETTGYDDLVESSAESPGDLPAYSLGAAFGRWDIRNATGQRPAPELSDPFQQLPLCPPGMLQGDDGLPISPEAGRLLRDAGDYPLDIAWDGILVDDPEHPLDIERRVRVALAVIWGDRADVIEHEVIASLGVPTLRDWFQRPSGFFGDHVKRYSKSRRQAPIYWPLSTKSGDYTLWLYYHRLNDQTLHKCLADFLDPKIAKVEKAIALLTGKSAGKAADLRDFVNELKDLRDEIERVIKLPWRPNLNDGVLITASPLWKLFRLSKWSKDLKACWEELEKGDYDWAHLAYTIWPARVEKVCESDRSVAIAHGLEHLCKVEPPKPKKPRGKKAPS